MKDERVKAARSHVIHKEEFVAHLEHIRRKTDDKEVMQELIRRSNEYITLLELEFSEKLFRRVHALYAIYFPELGGMLTSPKDFLLAVERLGCRRSHEELKEENCLRGVLPNAIEMNIKIMAASTEGRMLEEAEARELEQTLCEAQEVQARKRELL